MQLALQSPTAAPDLPMSSPAPLRRLPPQTSAVALAAVLSVGAHLLAVALWPPASFSVGADAAGGTAAAVSGGLVIDLSRPAPPAPVPAPPSAPASQVSPPRDAGIAVRSDTAPPLAPQALTPPVEAPSPVVEAPRPSAKPAPPLPVEPAAHTAERPEAPATPPAPAPVDAMPQPSTSTPTSTSAPASDAGVASASAPPSGLPAAQVRGDQATIPLLRSPRFLSRPAPPAYPSRAVQLGLEGTAVVRALVGGAGTPQEVRLIRSSGFDMLDEAALAAVRTWRFAAAVGVPRAWVDLPVRFQLH